MLSEMSVDSAAESNDGTKYMVGYNDTPKHTKDLFIDDSEQLSKQPLRCKMLTLHRIRSAV